MTLALGGNKGIAEAIAQAVCQETARTGERLLDNNLIRLAPLD